MGCRACGKSRRATVATGQVQSGVRASVSNLDSGSSSSETYKWKNSRGVPIGRIPRAYRLGKQNG